MAIDYITREEGLRRSMLQQPHRSAPPIAYYGNSEAQVLESCATGFGPRVPPWEKKYRLLLKYTKMLESDDYSRARSATCYPAHVSLAPYQKLKKLFGERKYASQYPSKRDSSSKTGFLDLPGELRNRIYAIAGVGKGQIFELLPLPNDNIWGRNTASNLVRQAFENYRNSIKPYIKLFRVNKQVNAEASELHYGNNYFRFSGPLGWIFVDSFFRLIGPANIARLSTLHVYTHWEGKLQPIGHYNDFYGDPEVLDWHKGIMGVLKIKYDNSADRGMFKARRRCIERLSAAGQLQQLTMVVPFDFEVKDVRSLGLPCTSFNSVTPVVKILHVNRPSAYKDNPHRSQSPLHEHKSKIVQKEPWYKVDVREVQEYRSVKAYAKAHGWEYKLAYEDHRHKFEGDAGYAGIVGLAGAYVEADHEDDGKMPKAKHISSCEVKENGGKSGGKRKGAKVKTEEDEVAGEGRLPKRGGRKDSDQAGPTKNEVDEPGWATVLRRARR